MSSNTRPTVPDTNPNGQYLTHHVSHHGRMTLIPPENAGRVRKTSTTKSPIPGALPKRTKKKRVVDANVRSSARSEENQEARFNLGTPRSGIRSVAGTFGRRTRVTCSTASTATAQVSTSGARDREGYGEDINIPDYPPPSFAEATSTASPSIVSTLSIAPSTINDVSANPSPISISGSTSNSESTSTSTTSSMTTSQRMLSIVVEPSSSVPSTPEPAFHSALPSPATSSVDPSALPCRHELPLPPTPQSPTTTVPQTPISPTSDSSSDTSIEIVTLPGPLEPSKLHWEEDRLLGFSLEERVKREWKRQRALIGSGSSPKDKRKGKERAKVENQETSMTDHCESASETESQSLSPGPSRRKSQDILVTDRGRAPGKSRHKQAPHPHPSWRLTLDEPSLRSVSSSPSLACQKAQQRPSSPLSPTSGRPSSPSPSTSRPYFHTGPAASSLSLGLNLNHIRLPGTFGRSTASLGVFSSSLSQTGGRENLGGQIGGSGSRRLFSKGKAKMPTHDRSFSDGDLDEKGEEEQLDSWEFVTPDFIKGADAGADYSSGGGSLSANISSATMATAMATGTSRVRPRLTLKPYFKAGAGDISVSTYEEKPAPRRTGDFDTRVDPFPLEAEPHHGGSGTDCVSPSSPGDSPETERPTSIMQTPKSFYPPETIPFVSGSGFHPSPTTTTINSMSHPPSLVNEHDQMRRMRVGSMRSRPAPPPPHLIKQFNRAAPPLPPTRTGSIQVTPTSSTSPLSRLPTATQTALPALMAPVAIAVLRSNSPIPVMTPTQLSPLRRRRTPPPPPPPPPKSRYGTSVSPAMYTAFDAQDTPLPPTPSDTESFMGIEVVPSRHDRGWSSLSIPSSPAGHLHREIEREVARLYPYSPGPHPMFNSSSSSPTVSNSQIPQLSSTTDFTARSRNPVDYTHVPAVSSRLALSVPTQSLSPAVSPASANPSLDSSRHHYPGRPLPLPPGPPSGGRPMTTSIVPRIDNIIEAPHGTGGSQVPEALLIDFDTDLDASVSGTHWGEDMDRTVGAVENDDLSHPPSVSSPQDGQHFLQLPASELSDFSDSSGISTPALAAVERPQYSHYTDLDLLVSHLEQEQQGGTDYDTLLLVQEFIGPATQPANANIATNTCHPASPSALLGKIDIERRRVTKAGRVKLKLSLLGVVVDKCGVCLSQFRESDPATLGVACQHAFHEKCLRTWLARSPTCPLCRVPLHISIA